MSPDNLISLSLVLTFGVPLLLAVRELIMLRYGGWSPRRHLGEPPTPRPEDDNSSLGLPPCLIPDMPHANQTARKKVLEPA